MRTPRIGIFPFSRKISKTHVGKSPKGVLCASEYSPDALPSMFLLNAVKARGAYGALCDLTIAWPAEALAKEARFNRRSRQSNLFETLPISFRIKGTNTKKKPMRCEITHITGYPVTQL